MSSPVDSIATPLVRGVLGALSALGIALAVAVVPALAAQVAGTASSATALDAILIGLSILVLGHGGGIMLSTGVVDGPVTVTPFGLLLLLLVLSGLSMRRVGRALRPVREDGALRGGALRDAGSALGAYALVYALGLAVLAGIGRSSDTSPVITSAVVSGLMVAVIGGLCGLLWSLRREPTEDVPGVRVLGLLPAPYGDVARSVLLAVTGLFALGMALVLVMMLVSVPAQSALFDGLAPGVVGGLVLTLVQLALLPLVAVWAMTVLLGGTIGVGTSTGISLDGAQTGVLPALPMLGALPGPGDFPAAAWLLMILPAVPVALGAVRLVRDVADLEHRDRIIAWVAYPVAVTLAVLLLAGLSTGGIGDGRLVHLGPQMSSLALPLIGIVVVSTGLVLAVLATPLVSASRGALGSLRTRVESAERSETAGEGTARSGRSERPDPSSGGEEKDLEAARREVLARFARRGSAAPTVSAEPESLSASSADEEREGPPAASPASAQEAEPEADLEQDAWALPGADSAHEESAGRTEGDDATEGDDSSHPDSSSRRRSWLSRREDR